MDGDSKMVKVLKSKKAILLIVLVCISVLLGALGDYEIQGNFIMQSGKVITDGSNSVTVSQIDDAHDHISTDGSSHTFIDQDVTSGSSPTFDGTNFTGIPAGALDDTYVNVDGTVPLTANWDAGPYEIRAATLESDIATGTAPLTIASTTKVTNLNADQTDGYSFDQDVTTTGTPTFAAVTIDNITINNDIINGTGTESGITADAITLNAVDNLINLTATTEVLLSGSGGDGVEIDSAWTAAGQTCADLGTVTTADIDGGTVNDSTLTDVTITVAATAAHDRHKLLGNGTGAGARGAVTKLYSDSTTLEGYQFVNSDSEWCIKNDVQASSTDDGVFQINFDTGAVNSDSTVTGATLTDGTFSVNGGTISAGTWNGTAIAHEYGGLEADVSAYNGIVKISGGATSAITDNSSNWDDAYTHSQDNTQAHSDYILNNASDAIQTSGTVALEFIADSAAANQDHFQFINTGDGKFYLETYLDSAAYSEIVKWQVDAGTVMMALYGDQDDNDRAARLHLTAGDTDSCQVSLYADDGDDNTDKVDIYVEDGGDFSIRDYGSGSWVTNVKVNVSGEVYLPQVYSDTVTGRDLYIASDGQLGYVSSTLDDKENVKDVNDNDTSLLYDLRPRIYDRKETGEKEIGLIAEEVDALSNKIPELVSYKPIYRYEYVPQPTIDENGDTITEWIELKEVIGEDKTKPETVNYSKLIVPLLREVQSLRAELDAQKAINADFENRLKMLERSR